MEAIVLAIVALSLALLGFNFAAIRCLDLEFLEPVSLQNS